MIESTPDPVISTDKEGNVVLFNEGAQTLLGYPAEDVVGRGVSLLHGSESEVESLLRGMLASRASADVGRPAGTKRKRRRRSAPGEVRPLH